MTFAVEEIKVVPTSEIIKRVNSAYIRADMAFRHGDKAEELKENLIATHEISTLLIRYGLGDQDISDEYARLYALSLENSAVKIHRMIKKGASPETKKEKDEKR